MINWFLCGLLLLCPVVMRLLLLIAKMFTRYFAVVCGDHGLELMKVAAAINTINVVYDLYVMAPL